MPLYVYIYMSVYQLIGVIISIFLLVLELYYFLSISIVDHSYISDNLHKDFSFRFLSSFAVAIQTVLFICYFLRFRRINIHNCICGIVAVLVSFSGWVTLNCDYTMPVHMIGFGIFVAAALVYWMIIFVLDKFQYITDQQNLVYFIAAFVFCITYCILYVAYNQMAWFYEHMGMIFFGCTNVYFFIYHDPNPSNVLELETIYKSVISEVIITGYT